VVKKPHDLKTLSDTVIFRWCFASQYVMITAKFCEEEHTTGALLHAKFGFDRQKRVGTRAAILK